MKRFVCCVKGERSNQRDEEQSGLSEENYTLQPNDPRYHLAPTSHLPYPPMPPYNTASDYNSLVDLPGESFLWEEIILGTENFKSTYYLGKGSFGKVYRCHLPRIKEVGAAKILDPNSDQGHFEFMAEITFLNEANHPNIIRFLGKCSQGTHRVIVYDFMPNGSLNYHLFDHEDVPIGITLQFRGLDWPTRMKIALGVAEGLVYLHTVRRKIHRDIKIGNILLDRDFVPKLTDFGLVVPIREVNGMETGRNIFPVKGTPGSIAPETAQTGYMSTKSDVFSYGVFLIQLVTGKKAVDMTRPSPKMHIVDWARPLLADENGMPLLADPALGGIFSVQGIKRILVAARMCICEHAAQRPAMEFVESLVREAGNYPIVEISERRNSI